jgi:hypothetical protein
MKCEFVLFSCSYSNLRFFPIPKWSAEQFWNRLAFDLNGWIASHNHDRSTPGTNIHDKRSAQLKPVFSVWIRAAINICHAFLAYWIIINLNLESDRDLARIFNFTLLIFDEIVFTCETFTIEVLIICDQANAFQTIQHIVWPEFIFFQTQHQSNFDFHSDQQDNHHLLLLQKHWIGWDREVFNSFSFDILPE